MPMPMIRERIGRWWRVLHNHHLGMSTKTEKLKLIQMSRYCLLTGHAMTRGKELHAGLTSANRFSFTAFILFSLLKTGRILMLIMLLVDSVDDSDNENGYTDIVL